MLVTGGEGMIARALPFGLKLSRAQLDVRDPAQVFEVVTREHPSAILHLAAVDIRQAEENPLAAYRTNVVGSYHLACAARERQTPFVFLSSGAVFNGPAGTVHDESAIPDPVNVFGQTKWLAELLLRETLRDLLLVVRTGWVFGGHQSHHLKFVDRAIELAARAEPIEAAVDAEGSPTSVADLVSALQELLLSGASGTVHVVNAGSGTGRDMAAVIVAAMRSASRIVDVRGKDLQNPGPPRPPSEALISTKVVLRPWPEALREYVFAKVPVRG